MKPQGIVATRAYLPKRRAYVLLINLTTLLFGSLSYADSFTDCNSNDPTLVISGCTTLISQQKLDHTTLAIAHSRRADAYLHQGSADKALADLRKAMEIDSTNTGYVERLVEALVASGDIAFKQKIFDTAISHYSAAIELHKSSDLLFARRAEAYIENNQVAQAISDLKEAINLNAKSSDHKRKLVRTYELRAIQLVTAGDIDEAANTYTEAIKINPKNTNIYLKRAKILFEKAEYDKALADLDKVYKQEPNNIDAFYLGGKISLGKRLFNESLTFFKRVLENNPKHLDAIISTAYAYEQLDNKKDAHKYYTKALVINSSYQLAKDGIKRLQQDKHELARLLQTYLKQADCYHGIVDGKWGPGSRKAAIRFLINAGESESNANSLESLQSIIEDNQSQKCSSGFKMFNNYAMDGGDYSVLRNVSRNTCRSQCRSSSSCRTFTYDRWNRICFLKNHIGELRLEPKAITGVAWHAASPSYSMMGEQMSRYRGKVFPNKGFESYSTYSFEDCEQYCANTSSCVAFSYFKHKRLCRLIDDPGEYYSKRGVDSGAKRQPPYQECKH